MRINEVPHYRPIVGSAISNDGNWVAVVSPRFAASTSDRLSELFLIQLERKDVRIQVHLPEGSEGYSPTFSPDSKRLAFFCREARKETIGIIELEDETLTPRWFTHTPLVPSALKWAGDELACLGNDPDGWRRVWRFETVDSLPVALTPSNCHAGDFAFESDGGNLVWLRIPTLDETLSEEVRLEWRDKDSGLSSPIELPGSPIGYLAFCPNDRYLAFQSRPSDHLLHHPQLWILSRVDGSFACTSVTRDIPGWITGHDWNEDGSALYVGLVQGTEGCIAEVSTDGQLQSTIAETERYFSGPHCDRSRGRLIHLEQASDMPQRLCLRLDRDGVSDLLTDFNEAIETVPVKAVTRRWSTDYKSDIEGVYYPSPPDESRGTIVWLHGGPAEQITHTFSPYFQVFAAAGFAVFCPNYRGSSGRDDAFLRSNVGRLGNVDVDDVVRGVECLFEEGLAEPSRTYAVGWSYGGSLALMTALKKEIFQAICVGAPVVDWVSFFGSRRLPSLYRDYFPTPLWEDRSLYDGASPLTHIASLVTSTLIFHGHQDPVVDVSQSRLLYRVLKARGVKTDLMVYPHEGHVPKATDAVADMLQRIINWLEDAHATDP